MSAAAFHRLLCSITFAAVVAGCSTPPTPVTLAEITPEAAESHRSKPDPNAKFMRSRSCANCHSTIYKQQNESMHARSYSNEVFRAQYFGEILPAAHEDPEIHKAARQCAACHMPVAYLENEGKLVTEDEIDPHMSGVTCDICHRIDGYKGQHPGNGNYSAVPGSTKYGPFVHKRGWHHRYLKLQTKSEFCAICHQRVNRHGLLVQATYAEWKESEYAKRHIQCQDCHMNARGYLLDDKPYYESGFAAEMVLGSAPFRRKLYSHNFPGARTETQIAHAIPMRVRLAIDSNRLDNAVGITVEVNNTRVGHKMPSGSIELRSLWLDVYVLSGTNSYNLIPSSAQGSRGYDVSCRAPGDRDRLGHDFPADKRIYRAVFLDSAGKHTDSAIHAKTLVFDNRLDASAIREEHYSWKVPEGFSGNATVVAALYYNAYPHCFSKRLSLKDADNILLTTARNLISVKGEEISFPYIAPSDPKRKNSPTRDN